jgi:hypothetical protein
LLARPPSCSVKKQSISSLNAALTLKNRVSSPPVELFIEPIREFARSMAARSPQKSDLVPAWYEVRGSDFRRANPIGFIESIH